MKFTPSSWYPDKDYEIVVEESSNTAKTSKKYLNNQYNRYDEYDYDDDVDIDDMH